MRPYLFVSGDGWQRFALGINAPDPANESQFGRSVSLSGNTLVIGSTDNGYVYEYDSGWSQVAILDAGFKVAADGDIAVVIGFRISTSTRSSSAARRRHEAKRTALTTSVRSFACRGR